jgi:hypothetical protein
MLKGCARSSKKGCGGRAAGPAAPIDDASYGLLAIQEVVDFGIMIWPTLAV